MPVSTIPLTSAVSGTLPLTNGGTATTGAPAFVAGNNAAQSVSSGAFTKVLLQNEVYDTNNNFASSRFTPTVAGYYQINGSVNFQASTSISRGFSTIYRNGNEWVRGTDVTGNIFSSNVAAIIYCNGTTDYIELYGYVAAGTPIFSEGTTVTQMSGCLVRAA